MKRSENYLEDERYVLAQKRVKEIKGFYIHVFVYLTVNAMLIFANSRDPLVERITDPSSYFTAFFWGIGLAAHGASVFGPGFFMGKNWEERKIKRLMEKEKENTKTWE